MASLLFCLNFNRHKNNEPSKHDPLTNIATGVVASDIITKDLLSDKECGKEALKFVEMRIGSELTKLSVPLKLSDFCKYNCPERYSNKQRAPAKSD